MKSGLENKSLKHSNKYVPKNVVVPGVPGVVRKKNSEKGGGGGGGSFYNNYCRWDYVSNPTRHPLPLPNIKCYVLLFSHLGHVFCSACLTNGITPLSSLLNVKSFNLASQEIS